MFFCSQVSHRDTEKENGLQNRNGESSGAGQEGLTEMSLQCEQLGAQQKIC